MRTLFVEKYTRHCNVWSTDACMNAPKYNFLAFDDIKPQCHRNENESFYGAGPVDATPYHRWAMILLRMQSTSIISILSTQKRSMIAIHSPGFSALGFVASDVEKTFLNIIPPYHYSLTERSRINRFFNRSYEISMR